MWVKICANTNLEDALMCAELGADAVGFVFAASKRQVTAEQVAAITPHLPERIEKIGVFALMSFDEIASAIGIAGLSGAQLHNSFDPDLTQRLRNEFGEEFKLIQVIHWNIDAGPDEADQFLFSVRNIQAQNQTNRILVDAKTPKASGGTGQNFDWNSAKPAFHNPAVRLPLILAGGLTAENVAGAIAILQPWGVDVASGSESSPGHKDREKLKAFLGNARKAS